MLEVLLWLLRRYSEQGVLLHVCSKAFQRRPFRMTSSDLTWLIVGRLGCWGLVVGGIVRVAWVEARTNVGV